MNLQQTEVTTILKQPARNVDELSFTHREPDAPIVWWNVEPPKSDLWDVHVEAGRGYGTEFIDYLDNPEKDAPRGDLTGEHYLSAILYEIVRKSGETPNAGVVVGFFEVVSERLYASRAY